MILFTSQPVNPLPDTDLPTVPIGEGSSYAVMTAVIFFLLNKGWDYAQARIKREDKKSDTELSLTEQITQKSVENKDKLLQQIQENQRILLDEVINRNDEALKTLQANLVTVLGVQAAISDNVKHYNELVNQRLNQIAEIMNRLDTSTSRSVVEAFSTQARLYADLKQNQFLMSNKIDKVHDRLDKHFGSDQDV